MSTASAAPGAVARKRLILFDVDGTLLSTGPAARTTFASALEEVYGTSGDVDGYAFEGQLDPLIVTELMRAAGVADETIAAGAPTRSRSTSTGWKPCSQERPPFSSRGSSPFSTRSRTSPGSFWRS